MAFSSKKLRLVASFGATYVIWGSTYLAIRYAVDTIPPFVMMGIRSIAAGSLLTSWSLIHHKSCVRRDHWKHLIILGALFFLVGHGLLAWAQKRISSGVAALALASEPLWIAIIEGFIVKNARVGWLGIVGLLTGFVGILVLVKSNSMFNSEDLSVGGLAAALLGSAAWAIGAVYQRIAPLPEHPMLTAGVELMFGGAMLLAGALFLGEFARFDVSALSARSLWSLGYLIVFGSVIGFAAYTWLLTVSTATKVSTHTFVNPIIAVFLGWGFAGESLNTTMIVATTLVVSSVVAVLSDQKLSGQTKNVSLERRIQK